MLLERHFADLRAVWNDHLPGEEPAHQRISRTVEAWFAYVETRPYAWRMLFQGTTGQDEIEAMRRDVAAESRALILPLFAREHSHAADGDELDMAWEAWRGAIHSLGLWWHDHRDVPRARVVAAA